MTRAGFRRNRGVVRLRTTGVAAVVAAFFVVAATGCSSPDESVSSPIDERSAPSVPKPPQDDAPRNDLSEERVVIWQETEVVTDTKLRVVFGPEPTGAMVPATSCTKQPMRSLWP